MFDDDAIFHNNMIDTMFTIIQLLVVIVGAAKLIPMSRNASLTTQRYKWRTYIDQHEKNPIYIKRHLRMSISSFYKLLSFIKKELVVNEFQAARRGGPISPEICLFCTLRWLAGASYLDIYCITGVSIPSFYRVIYKTLNVIANCQQLEIIFPTTKLECAKVALGFQEISYQEAVINCVGCIDGYLLRIPTPSKKWAGNVRSFFLVITNVME
jgi:hypothetical protein